MTATRFLCRLCAVGAVLVVAGAFLFASAAFAVQVPNETVTAATEIGETTVTLHGRVEPVSKAPVIACQFEYLTEAAFQANPAGERFAGAATTICAPNPAVNPPTSNFTTNTNVTAALEGLSPSTTYRFRLTASNSTATTSSAERTFQTSGPPVVTDEKASTPYADRADLSATIDASGFEADCHVEYVTEAAFQESGFATAAKQACSPAEVPAASTEEAVSATLAGLALNTTYHYRFVSTNSSGTTQGPDRTFATFGIQSFSFEVLDREGHPYTQAGGHPYEWRTGFKLNTTPSLIGAVQGEVADTNIRDVETELPAGLIASGTATPRCTRYLMTIAQCSPATQVGVIAVEDSAQSNFHVGLYNIVPPSGTPVELGAVVHNIGIVYIDGNVRTGGDYGATAKVLSSSQADNITEVHVSVWGVPADPGHDGLRSCVVPGQGKEGPGPCPPRGPLIPLLTNPTSCPGTALLATLRVDSWQAPGEYVSAKSEIPATTGCESLDFTPSMMLAPDTTVADSPSGLDANLDVPQNESPSGLASSALENTSVQLPAGVSISPSAANGLEACSEAQIGLHSEDAPTCPNGSKIGTVEIVSPLLSDRLVGGVFVAKQGENPFGSLFAMYMTAEADGARVKLAGHVVADPVTGQLTTTFDETPQLPFSDLKLHLFGGRRGVLATPEACGTFTSTVALAPWDGLAATVLKPTFPIGSGCVSGFKPSLSAGTVSTTAGAYTPFTLSLARSDSEEEMTGLAVKLPPGLLAKIAGVTQCTDAQAASDTCPAGSQIGTVQATAGPGLSPLSLPGRMYFTGPYEGAPYGEEVVVPAVAGPFNLGDVVVRGKIQIDPVTAQATVTSDPFPTIVQGIPTRLRRVDVTVNRPGFTFNPTSCRPLAIDATATSVGAAAAVLQSRFQVGGCGELSFKPSFKVSTSGKTSRKNGASLHVKLTYPKAPFGSQANIRSVHVELPKALPSRNSTLNHACLEAVFNRNPAGCPSESRVGIAKALTPVLPVPLEGPAYFVSHGGRAFPELVVVLQGYGVTVDLQGETFISKTGITSSTFKTVPDVPVDSFELTLPEGPFSALGANTDLCTTNLTMPTLFHAQNGATLKQNTPIEVEGCPYSLRILARRVHSQTLTLQVTVPAAGKLVASGKGVSGAAKSVSGRQTLTLTLKERRAGKLRTKISLRFTPSGATGKQRGKVLRKSLTVTFR